MSAGAGTPDTSGRRCAVCGGWGAFGFDDFRDRPGRYACRAHADEVARMSAAPAPRGVAEPASGGAEVAA